MNKNLIIIVSFIICIVTACGRKAGFVASGKNEVTTDDEETETIVDVTTEDGIGTVVNTTEETVPLNRESHYDADGKLRINLADKSELVKLSGIGEKKACAILQYREQYGNFNSPEEIKNVKGIKDGTFDKIKDYITVD